MSGESDDRTGLIRPRLLTVITNPVWSQYRSVQFLHVEPHVGGLGEGAAAVGAAEGPLPGVAQQMSAQLAGRYKPLAAVLALVSVLPVLPPLPLLLHQTNLRHNNARAQTTPPVPSTDIAILQ